MELENKIEFDTEIYPSYRIALLAFHRYGKDAQMRQMQEECAKLITAINHHLRGRDPKLDEVIEELADVLIVANQLIIGLDLKDNLHRQISFKLQKLETKINQPWQLSK